MTQSTIDGEVEQLIYSIPAYSPNAERIKAELRTAIQHQLAQEANKAVVAELENLPITRPTVGIPHVSEGYILSRLIELRRQNG